MTLPGSQGPSPELVSAEEIDGLLGELDVASEPPTAEPRRAVVLARDRAEAADLSDRLRRRGVEVTVVGDPFRALDALRRHRPAWVLTELAPWPGEGRLLFDRLRESESGAATAIVILGDAGEAPSALRWPSPGGRPVRRLFRPWDDAAIADLVGEGSPQQPERAAPGRAEPERAEPGGAEPERAEPERAEPERAEPERAEPERAEAPSRSAADAADTRWLRFFFDVRRGLRGVTRSADAVGHLLDELDAVPDVELVTLVRTLPWGAGVFLPSRIRDQLERSEIRRPLGELIGGQAPDPERVLIVPATGGSGWAALLIRLAASGVPPRPEFLDELGALVGRLTGGGGRG